MLKRTIEFLQVARVFFVATLDDDQPRVRPFGLVLEQDGRLYFVTGNGKAVYRQLQANPRLEISAVSPSGHEWLRLTGKAVFEQNAEVKKAAFTVMPALADIYGTPDNPSFEVFYLMQGEATFCSFVNPPESGTLT